MNKRKIIEYIIAIIIIILIILLLVSFFKNKNKIESDPDDILMFEIRKIYDEGTDDYLKESNYKIKYNGKISKYDEYAISGIKNETEENMSVERLRSLQNLLDDYFVNTESNNLKDENYIYDLIYYDRFSNIIHEYKGSLQDEYIISIVYSVIENKLSEGE